MALHEVLEMHCAIRPHEMLPQIIVLGSHRWVMERLSYLLVLFLGTEAGGFIDDTLIESKLTR